MQTTGATLLATKRRSLVRVLMPVRDGRSAYGLLDLAAVRDDRRQVKRNVVLLCEVPQGRTGRPSKSLTLAQAEALLAAAENTSLRAYIVCRFSPAPGPRNSGHSPGPTLTSTATCRS